MKTDDLIGLLAAGAGPSRPARPFADFAPALLAGLAAAVALSLLWRGPVPAAMWAGAAPWTKLAYAAALAAACVWAAARLGRPGLAASRQGWLAAGVVLAMTLAGAVALSGAAPPERLAYLLGQTAPLCPWAILILSLPTLLGLLRALREQAPTRPALAGLAAGLAAGAVGAAGYALSCAEGSIAFIALWYSAGIALSGLLGAGLGARLLRW